MLMNERNGMMTGNLLSPIEETLSWKRELQLDLNMVTASQNGQSLCNEQVKSITANRILNSERELGLEFAVKDYTKICF